MISKKKNYVKDRKNEIVVRKKKKMNLKYLQPTIKRDYRWLISDKVIYSDLIWILKNNILEYWDIN